MKLSIKHLGSCIPRYKTLKLSILVVMTMSIGCKKLVTVDAPVTSISQENVFKGNATASAVLTGLYGSMSSSSLTSTSSVTSLSLYAGLSADELQAYTAQQSNFIFYYRNALTSGTEGYWNAIYSPLFICNSAIEGIEKSSTLDARVKKQLMGEAKFMRGFFYFYLVNLFGDVPLVLNTDYESNRLLSRSSKEVVYHQILADLLESQQLLSSEYLSADCITTTEDRVRPSKGAANALLARTYLYKGDYGNAEKYASLVLGDSRYNIETLNTVFLNSSKEVVWSLQPVNLGQNTPDARTFVLTTAGPNLTRPVYLNSYLLNAFEAGDKRKTDWITSRTIGGIPYSSPFKYKVSASNVAVTEYSIVIRLAEMYLIRAEAYAQQNNFADAKADLDIIRKRAGLDGYAGQMDKLSLVKAILHEKQVELFSEWGHRWLDLKRSGTVDEVMSEVTTKKGGAWKSSYQLYPIPISDLDKNRNLVQNPDYN